MYVQLSFSYKEMVFIKRILSFLRLKRLLKSWRKIIGYHMIRYRQKHYGFPDIAFSIPILREDRVQRSFPWLSWLRKRNDMLPKPPDDWQEAEGG